MVCNWRQILGKRTWSHSFTFLRQARNHMVIAGFSISKNERFVICGKSIDDNLYPYHVVLTTKAKDRRPRGFRRSAKEKLSNTAQRNVLVCVLPCALKHSASLATATVSCISEKNSLPVLIVSGSRDQQKECSQYILSMEYSGDSINSWTPSKLTAVRMALPTWFDHLK